MPKSVTGEENFIPGFPIRWLRMVHRARAYPALGLLLALHRKFYMRGHPRSVYLTSAIWAVSGVGEGRGRVRALNGLRKLSQLVVLDRAPAPWAYWRVSKGPEWDLEGSSSPDEGEDIEAELEESLERRSHRRA